MRETRVRSLGKVDPLEKKVATHSSTLACKILWTEEPGRLQSIELQRVGHNWATSQCPSPYCSNIFASVDTLLTSAFMEWFKWVFYFIISISASLFQLHFYKTFFNKWVGCKSIGHDLATKEQQMFVLFIVRRTSSHANDIMVTKSKCALACKLFKTGYFPDIQSD